MFEKIYNFFINVKSRKQKCLTIIGKQREILKEKKQTDIIQPVKRCIKIEEKVDNQFDLYFSGAINLLGDNRKSNYSINYLPRSLR